MTFKENLEAIIEESVSKLTYAWYSQKLKSFLDHPSYDSGREEIIIKDIQTSPEYDYDDEGNQILLGNIITENIYKFNQLKFYESYLPLDSLTYWGSFPAEDNFQGENPSQNIEEFSHVLLDEVSNIAEDISDIKAVHSFVQRVLNLISEKLEHLKTAHPEELNYIKVLDRYSELCVVKFYDKYSREIFMFEGMNAISNRLEFSLSQDQLVSLVYIIQRAGLFNYTNNSPIFKFVLDYFCYLDRRKKIAKPKSLDSLSKIFSDISGTQRPKAQTHEKALHEVAAKLKSVIDKLN
jgi:hypothetical protein